MADIMLQAKIKNIRLSKGVLAFTWIVTHVGLQFSFFVSPSCKVQ